MKRASSRRFLEFLLLTVLAFNLLIRGLLPAWQQVHHDFPNYYVSARMILAGEDPSKLYDDQWFNNRIKAEGIDEEGKFTPFPPVTAFLLTPVAALSPLTAKRVWVLVNLLLLGLHVVLIGKVAGLSWVHSTLLVLALGSALANNFLNGQMYLLISALAFLAYRQYELGKHWTAGMLLAFAAAIKYFPVVFILVFLLHRKWKLVVSAAITIGVILLAQFFYFGAAVQQQYLHVLVSHLDGQISNQNIFVYQFQSWNSFLSRLFIFDDLHNPEPWLLWLGGKPAILFLLYASFASSLAFIWFKIKRQKQIEVTLALSGLAVLALLPASATYHYILLLLPVTLLLRDFQPLANSRELIWLTVFLAIGFIPYGWFWNEGYPLIILYPRLWLINLFFALSVWMAYSRVAKGSNRAIT